MIIERENKLTLIQIKELESNNKLVLVQNKEDVDYILDSEGLNNRKADFNYLLVQELNGEYIKIYGTMTAFIEDYAELVKEIK